MQAIRVFVTAPVGKQIQNALEFVERPAPNDLEPTGHAICELLTLITGITPLRAQVFFVNEIDRELSPNDSSHTNAARPNPSPGSRGDGIYSVAYDDVEILIDRTVNGRIDIRVWRTDKSDKRPCAAFSFSLDDFVCGNCGRSEAGSAECTKCERCILCCVHDDERCLSGPYHVVRELDTGKLSIWPLKRLLAEINRGRSGSWAKYTVHDWEGGWHEFVEGNEYELLSPSTGFADRVEAVEFRARRDQSPDNGVDLTQIYESLEVAINTVCDRDLQNAIAFEYRRQIMRRSETGNMPASEWLLKARSVYRGIDRDLS